MNSINSNSRSSINSYFKTNPKFRSPLLVKFLITLFIVIIPMIILFVLFGEINALGQNGIVGIGARWYGEGFRIENNNVIVEKDFFKWLPIDNQIYSKLSVANKSKIDEILANIQNITGARLGERPITYYPVWVALFSNLAVALIISISLAAAIPKVRWDILTPVISSWFGMFIFIISGFIPSEVWGYLVRFLIMAVAFLIPIMIMTKLTNFIMSRSKHFEENVVEMYNELKESEYYYMEAAKKRLELKSKNKSPTKFKIEDDKNKK